jgi:hypothetical protein
MQNKDFLNLDWKIGKLNFYTGQTIADTDGTLWVIDRISSEGVGVVADNATAKIGISKFQDGYLLANRKTLTAKKFAHKFVS